ncbi:hypothetical protein CDAR_384151, partial [Caerostris darwini]
RDLTLNRGLFEEIVDELWQEYHRVVSPMRCQFGAVS